MQRTLDLLVTAVATHLMAATASDVVAVSQDVLAELVSYFKVDVSFLRHNEHDIRASRLIAEWPPRDYIPDPDPLSLVYFATADPVFAMAEKLTQPIVTRPREEEDYQRLIEEGSHIPATSMAAAPLMAGQVTAGVLGFVKFGDREWPKEELNALMAIAALFAQLKGRIEAEEQLRYMADHDDMTGLFNRRALIAHLDRRLSADSVGPVATLFLDLDRLKAINDHLGHAAGDRFIHTFADRLCAEVGVPAFIARLGGDEFVVVPDPPMGADAAAALAQGLQDRLQEQVSIEGEQITRTVSIGVASGEPGVDESSDLLRRADQAVLTAKGAGGNQLALFTEEMSRDIDLRNDIELHLQGVIESGALDLQYLPEVDMRTGKVLGAEALVRWRHPTRGMLYPASFIEVAESINLAGELGRWVLHAGCTDFARWRAKGLGLDMILRINISPVQLVTDGFAQSVAQTVTDLGLDCESVCLEITESVVVRDIEATRVTLSSLKKLGLGVAIDDFGTGYGVLSHLKSLPVDTLKIDKGFVRDLGTDAGDLAIVRAIAALAEAFGLELVAEGVETVIAAQTLLNHGCHRAQGYLMSRPVAADAMADILAAGYLPIRFTQDADDS